MATYSNSAREVEMPNGDVVVLHNAPTGGANTTSNIKKFKYDDNGHVTESTAADAEDLNLSSYSTPTTGTTAIGTSDDVQTAIGKLDHQSHIDQTNILYVSGKTGKNIFNSSDTFTTPTGLTITKNADGSFTVSGTSTTTVNVGIGFLVLDATKTYVLSGCPNGGNSDTYSLLFGTTGYTKRDIGTGVTLTSAPANTPLTVYISIGANYAVNKTFYPMICTAEDWAIGHDYVPYALPNYDLTRLEAEDRTSLAEEIDAGAKNKFDFTNAVFTDVKAASTKTSTSITITADSNGDWSRSYTSVNLAAGSYVFTTTISNYSKTVGAPVIYIASSATGGNPYGTATITGNGTVTCSFNIPTTGTYYLCYYVNDTATASGVSCSYTASNNMICTKAAFGVSSKFVPYRPNWDLVASVNKYEKTNMVFTTDSAITTVFDLENSYAYQYYNAFLGKVVVYMDLLTKASISTLDSKTIAWVKNGTNNTYNFEWTQPVTSGDALFRFTKPNTSTGVVMRLQSGTVASGVHIYVRFEYDIY